MVRRGMMMFTGVMLALALALAACGEPAVDPADIPGSGLERGTALFALNLLGDRPGCITCHSQRPGEVLIGPAVPEMAAAATEQETGLDAEAYLRQSILEPDAHLAPGFNPGAMPAYGDTLRPEDVDDLVAYILSYEP